MDPATAVLKRTFACDQEENLQAIETLLAKDKAGLNAFRSKHCLPFKTFKDVPDSDDSDDDEDEEKPFLRCIHNSGDSNAKKEAFRSPWTGRWYIIDEEEEKASESFEKPVPTDEVDTRAIEKAANEVWEAYAQLYYGREAVGSVFLKPNHKKKGNSTKHSFEGMFGIQKRTSDDEEEAAGGGAWDSVHFVTVDEPKDKECEYRVESAVLVSLNPYEETTIGCSLTKETVKKCKIRPSSIIGSHLENLGTIIEAVEIEFRSKMERVDVPKSMEVMQSIYRKQKAGATAHLISGGGGGGPAMMATGMGVGAGMIGEIANKAKAKKGGGGPGGPNPFMEAMQKNLKAKEKSTTAAAVDGTGDQYTDLKKTLKKGPNPLAAEAKKKKQEAAASTSPTPEFMNFRSKLKKTGGK